MLRSILSRRIPISSVRGATRQFRPYSSTPTPEYKPPTTQAPNAHRAFYQSFGIPVVKVFLGALLTYQVIYFGWLSLEDLENRKTKDEEVKTLEGKLAELAPPKPTS